MNIKEQVVENHQLLSFSKLFAMHGEGAHVFWPGCAVLSLGEELAVGTYQLLQELIPDLSYSTMCCGKPSIHIRGGEGYPKRLAQIQGEVAQKGTRVIYTMCPNCYNTLGKLEDVEIRSIWKILDEQLPARFYGVLAGRAFSLHDPCPIKQGDLESAEHVRSILSKMGAEVLEFAHNRANTICCGKRNMLMALDPKRAEQVFAARAKEAPSREVVTYCASCKATFGDRDFTSHYLLELMLGLDQKGSWKKRYQSVRALKRTNKEK